MLFSDVQQKCVVVHQSLGEEGISLPEVVDQSIIFHSVFEATQILTEIPHPKILKFVANFEYAPDVDVYLLLQLLLTTDDCIRTMRELTLSHVSLQFFDLMPEFNPPSNDLIFPHLKSIILFGVDLNPKILHIFHHVEIAVFNDPPYLFLDSPFITNITFPNLKKLELKVGATYSDKFLPIESESVEVLKIIFDRPIGDDSISIRSLANMRNLRILIIKGGAKAYNVEELEEILSKINLKYLMIPLDEKAEVEDVQNLICTKAQANEFKFVFILNHLQQDRRALFQNHKTIHCQHNNAHARYEVKFKHNQNQLIKYRVTKTITHTAHRIET